MDSIAAPPDVNVDAAPAFLAWLLEHAKPGPIALQLAVTLCRVEIEAAQAAAPGTYPPSPVRS